MSKQSLVLPEQIEQTIYLLRGHRVMLDADLAALYAVETKALNQAVKRNAERFPADFMFQLTQEEGSFLRSQIVTSKIACNFEVLSSAEPSIGRGGRRFLPFAFTEQGVAMLSTVLRSPRAVQVNIEIMRAFVRLRQMLLGNAELASKLASLEKNYNAQFKIVFDAIRELMNPPVKSLRRIGFGEGYPR